MARKARKSQSAATMVCISALLITVAVGGVIAVLLQDKSPAPSRDEESSAQAPLSIQGEDVARKGPLDGVELSRDIHDDSEFHYILNGAPSFKNSKAKGSVALENPNTNSSYMRVDYVLEDDGVTVYRSPMLPPGWSVAQDRLYEQLDKGEYEATALVAIYENADDESPLQIFEEYITITVEK